MKKILLVDVDGTLAEYKKWEGIHKIGKPIKGAVEFVNALAKDYRIHIWTTRCNLDINRHEVPEITSDIVRMNNEGYLRQYAERYLVDLVKGWLDKNGFKYDMILTGKPHCSAFIDDRAINCVPQERETSYEEVLKHLGGRESERL